MKKFFVIFFLIFLLVVRQNVFATPPGDEVNSEVIKRQLEVEARRQITDINTDDWDAILKELKNQGSPVAGDVSAKKIIEDLVEGKFDFDVREVFRSLMELFFGELLLNINLMAQIIIISIICGMIKNLQSSFVSSSTGEIAYFACYITIVVLIMKSLASILAVGRGAITQMVSFMKVFFPVILAFLVLLGGTVSSAVLQPVVAMLVGLAGILFKEVMIPLILLSAVFVVINSVSNEMNLSRLGALFKNLCSWILGIVFTVFTGVLAVQGILAASYDGISIRMARYAIETFMPIVGGMLSKTLDIVIGCSFMVKNAIGVAGLIIIGMICFHPVVKILSFVILYKLTAALVEPVSDGRVAKCLDEVGGVLAVLFVTVVGVAIMFFITVALIIGVGNIAVMMG